MGVYKRKGKWEVRLQLRGVKYYRQVPEAANKAQAQVAEANMRLEIFEGRYGKAGEEVGAHDFVDFARRFYLPHKKDIVTPLTYKSDLYRVNILCEHFKGRALREVSQLAVESFRRRLLSGPSQYGRGVTPATAKAYVNTLSQLLDYAIENDMLGLNPCRKIKWARGSTLSRRDRVMSAEEEARLFPLLTGEVKAAAVLALNTGMRKCSLLRLRVEDVDLKARAVTFTGKRGRRQTAPVNPAALAVLRELADAAAAGGFLFHNRRGHNLSSTAGAFQKAVRAVGIGDFHFHDLRHTFASRLRLHADAFTVRDLMGHTKVDTTDIYVTSNFEERRRAVDSLCNVKEFHRGFTSRQKAG
jgi:integrase